MVAQNVGAMRMAYRLEWNKCAGGEWCPLNTVDLDHQHFDGMEGVYVIWHGGAAPATVRVGQGVIRDRLAEHRTDGQVQAYSDSGLYVTWAAIPAQQRDGVEAFLADALSPKIGQRFPAVERIAVNLPW
jgi:hypothetical protein